MTDDYTTPSAPFLAQFTLHPAQAAFVACAERFSFYVGGVGAGKTMAGAVRAIARALDAPGSLGLIGAPTYPMLRDATQRTVFALLERVSWTDRGIERPAQSAEGLKPLDAGGQGPSGPRSRVPAIHGRESVSLAVPRSLRAGRVTQSHGREGKDGTLPYTYNKSEGHLMLANGSEILLRSLDEPDRVRGLNLAWFWLDEAPLCGYYA
ncbi:MAG TPA: hypothetical protein VF120_08695 [Ktedonobacterales bacterium]